MKLTRKISFRKEKQLLYFLLGALALFALDLASKWIVEKNVKVGQLVAVIPNFFYITKSYNTAIAFSLGSNLPLAVGRSINIVISTLMSIAIVWYWLLHDEKFNAFQRTIAMLMLAGAFGNLIDRAFYWQATTGFDGVIDWLSFYLGGGPNAAYSFVNPFATFNLADSYLVIGVILLLILMIIDLVKESKADSSLSEDPRLQQKPQKIEEKKEDSEKK